MFIFELMGDSQQILSVSVLSYFENIHGLGLGGNSNALRILSTLIKFREVHSKYKNQFRTYNGLDFETIMELLLQDIHRIEQTHKDFVAKGLLLTENTKQYTIEAKLKADVKDIVKEVIDGIESYIPGTSAILEPKQIAAETRLKALKKRKKRLKS